MRQAMTIMILLIGFGQYANAQTFSEWFRQKQTQKKYLLEQIAALKLYGSYVKKGYDISKKGLGMIGDLKDGDLKIHEGYFNKLKSVNPEISKSPKVKEMISLQEETKKLADKSKKLAKNSSVLTNKEVDYISRVYERLSSDCLKTITALEQVTRQGQMEMKDDERLERIEKLHQESLAQYRFAKSFGSSIILLLYQKGGEQKEIKNLRTQYGFKNDLK